MKEDNGCCKPIMTSTLDELILSMLNVELLKQVELADISKVKKDALKERLSLLEDKIKKTQGDIRKLEQEVMKAYEDYADGHMDVDGYKHLSVDIRSNINEAQNRLTMYEGDLATTEGIYCREGEGLMEPSKCIEIKQLTHDIANDFIDNVIVRGDGAIEVAWSFRQPE
jgi:chromosome segregation ATPase